MDVALTAPDAVEAGGSQFRMDIRSSVRIAGLERLDTRIFLLMSRGLGLHAAKNPGISKHKPLNT